MDKNTVFLIGLCLSVYILFAAGMLWLNRNLKNDKRTFRLMVITLMTSFIGGIALMIYALSN